VNKEDVSIIGQLAGVIDMLQKERTFTKERYRRLHNVNISLNKELKAHRKALQFYADKGEDCRDVGQGVTAYRADLGERARDVLAKFKGE